MKIEYPKALRFRLCFSLVFLAALFLLGRSHSMALLVIDDFSYPAGNLAGNNGGSGFSGAWAGSTIPQVGLGSAGVSYENPNLISTVTGYSITQTGNGQVYGVASSGVSTRSLASSYVGTSTGTSIWFSILVDSNNSSGREGLYFNVTGTARTGATAGFLVPGGSAMQTISNGTSNATAVTPAGGHVVHLIVGQITLFDGANSSLIQLWVDPTNVTNVLTSTSTAGASYLSYNANFGGSLSNVGIEDYNNGSLDAFRMSDGAGDATTAFYDVVSSVPEPASMTLVLVGGMVIFSACRKSKDSIPV